MQHVNSSDANRVIGEDTSACFTVGGWACTQSSTIMSSYKDLLMLCWSCPSPSHATHSIGQGRLLVEDARPSYIYTKRPYWDTAGPVAALSSCSRISSWLAALLLLISPVCLKPFFPASSSSQLCNLDTAIFTRLWKTILPSSIST